MNHTPTKRSGSGSVPSLIAVTVLGQIFAYLIAVMVARKLSSEEFQAYAVASSVFILMVIISMRGLEKYGLRYVSAKLAEDGTDEAAGYVNFAIWTMLKRSIFIGAIVAIIVAFYPGMSLSTRNAIFVSCLAVAAGALVHLAVEILGAKGRVIQAGFVFRLLVPAVVLVAFTVCVATIVNLTGAIAVGCWTVAWLCALLFLILGARKDVPAIWRQIRWSDESARLWVANARVFHYHRIAMVLIAQSPIIAIDRLYSSSIDVGSYVAAYATANLLAVLVGSTNRFYGRQMAILLDQGDFPGLLRLRNQRLAWLLPVLAIYLFAVFMFGEALLSVFRADFARTGYAPLVIVSVGTAISTLFSLSPTFLKYSERNRFTLTTVLAAALAQLILLAVLVPHYGAMGAAISFALASTAMYGFFAWRSLRDVKAHVS